MTDSFTSPDFVAIDADGHFRRLRELLEAEETEEIEQFRQDFTERTPEDREKAGLALLRLIVHETHFNAAGHRLLSFRYADRRSLPVFTLETGDLVTLSREGEESLRFPVGTVYAKDPKTITVAFSQKLPDWVSDEGTFHLNRAGSRATYRKMQEALEEVSSARHGRLAFLRDVSLGLKKPESGDPVAIGGLRFFNLKLNDSQKEAVRLAEECRDFALVHGPPGTGKTTVLVEVIRQAVSRNEFVFATAPSNTACDHLLDCLVRSGVAALRLGHPARIAESLRAHTLDFKLAAHPNAALVDDIEAGIVRLERKRERHRDRRALEAEARRELSAEIHALRNQLRTLRAEIFEQVLREAPVMVGTHVAAADPLLSDRAFDLLVMDEATQSVEPGSWIPLLRARKAVFAGDPFQLPPTVRSKKAAEGGLEKTLFERLQALHGDSRSALLKVQYRMHEKIMNFSSRQFYGGALTADPSVRSHCLADLPQVTRCPATEENFIFIDTAGRGFEEILEEGSESRYNPEEAGLVLSQIRRLTGAGVPGEGIAVISPYSAQVRFILNLAAGLGIEVDSVDGFQGREKEAVLVSLVRSNLEGEMGFLADTRRMNVAMTRARRKLFVIGDSGTLATIPFYRDFIQYAEAIGAYRSAWDEEL